jgi:hypothetical protein
MDSGQSRAELIVALRVKYPLTSGHREAMLAELADALIELERLKAIINTPEIEDWMNGVAREAAHQQERWGVEHDGGKTPADWFWLIGYLAGKALFAAIAGNVAKLKHHTISTGAVLLNWHRHASGAMTRMRPGIVPPAELADG